MIIFRKMILERRKQEKKRKRTSRKKRWSSEGDSSCRGFSVRLITAREIDQAKKKFLIIESQKRNGERKEHFLILGSEKKETKKKRKREKRTLDRRGQMREGEELVEGPEPGARAAHLLVAVRRRLLGRRRHFVSRDTTASGGAPLGILAGGVLGGRGAEAWGAGDDVKKPPHVRDGALLVVVLCTSESDANGRSVRKQYWCFLAARFIAVRAIPYLPYIIVFLPTVQIGIYWKLPLWDFDTIYLIWDKLGRRVSYNIYLRSGKECMALKRPRPRSHSISALGPAMEGLMLRY